jgi:hypothetical protein
MKSNPRKILKINFLERNYPVTGNRNVLLHCWFNKGAST